MTDYKAESISRSLERIIDATPELREIKTTPYAEFYDSKRIAKDITKINLDTPDDIKPDAERIKQALADHPEAITSILQTRHPTITATTAPATYFRPRYIRKAERERLEAPYREYYEPATIKGEQFTGEPPEAFKEIDDLAKRNGKSLSDPVDIKGYRPIDGKLPDIIAKLRLEPTKTMLEIKTEAIDPRTPLIVRLAGDLISIQRTLSSLGIEPIGKPVLEIPTPPDSEPIIIYPSDEYANALVDNALLRQYDRYAKARLDDSQPKAYGPNRRDNAHGYTANHKMLNAVVNDANLLTQAGGINQIPDGELAHRLPDIPNRDTQVYIMHGDLPIRLTLERLYQSERGDGFIPLTELARHNGKYAQEIARYGKLQSKSAREIWQWLHQYAALNPVRVTYTDNATKKETTEYISQYHYRLVTRGRTKGIDGLKMTTEYKPYAQRTLVTPAPLSIDLLPDDRHSRAQRLACILSDLGTTYRAKVIAGEYLHLSLEQTARELYGISDNRTYRQRYRDRVKSDLEAIKRISPEILLDYSIDGDDISLLLNADTWKRLTISKAERLAEKIEAKDIAARKREAIERLIKLDAKANGQLRASKPQLADLADQLATSYEQLRGYRVKPATIPDELEQTINQLADSYGE